MVPVQAVYLYRKEGRELRLSARDANKWDLITKLDGYIADNARTLLDTTVKKCPDLPWT